MTTNRRFTVTLMSALLALVMIQPSPSKAARQPGPGLGSSDAPPAGRPVRLALPAGYTLLRIEGGESDEFIEEHCFFVSDPADPPAACRYGRGMFTVTLILHYEPAPGAPQQPSNLAACQPQTVTWSGWVLTAESGAAQNIMVPIDACVTVGGAITPVLVLPSPGAAGVVALTLGGYCLNLDRSVPESGDAYSAGVITDDPVLLAVLSAIHGKNLHRFASWRVIQETIWDYTDGDGLPPEALERIAELP